jgi:hypothetical protein
VGQGAKVDGINVLYSSIYTPTIAEHNQLTETGIHGYNVSMQKMQILFPEPQLSRLRKISESLDRPVSELVRSAVEFWLSRYGEIQGNMMADPPPVYGCGAILTDSREFREMATEDRETL